MKLGIDIRPLQLQHSVRGIGMHVKALVVELLENPSQDDELIFYMYEGLDDPIKKLNLTKRTDYSIVWLKNYKEDFRFLPGVVSASIAVVRRVLMPLPRNKVRQCDVLLGFDFMQGLPRKRSVRYVLIAYDLIPIMYQKDYFPSFRASLRGAGLLHALHTALVAYLYKKALRLVRQRRYRILSISDSTKEQFIRIAKIKPSLIRTVHLGNPLTSKDFSMDFTELDRVIKYQKNSYIFFIGGNDSRRRIQDVVHAFNQLRGRGNDLKFIFAGFDFQRFDTIVNYKTRKAIETSSYIDDIELLGFVNDSEKKYLYENALCFVFPSISEGFGLPILEAMHEKCPVIAYDYPLSSMAEVAGDAAILTKPGMENVYSALEELIVNPELGKALVAKGLKNVQRFSWEKCAHETISHLKDPDF